ncbi:MAG: 2-hydroxyacid dehydrogenase [Tissierellia bacterium]|nr:2-hydroxyacid dehydrogenase [Tissierellia bacterium]
MKILITAEMDPKYVEEIKSNWDVDIEGWSKEYRLMTEEEMQKLVPGYDVLITSYDEITKKVIDAGKDLKLIICTRANPVNIDIDYAKEKNIKISYAPGRNSDCTAEFTVAMMMSVGRNIPKAHHELKLGKHTSPKETVKDIKSGLREDVTWDLSATSPYVIFKGRQLYGNTVGIIGYGNIGRRVGEILKAFGMNILVYSPSIKEELEGVKKVGLEELLKESDYITIHSAAIEKNRHLIGKKEFDMMKETAYFINTSRGMLVDEEALIEALREEKIAGAAVDVYASEPIAIDHPFITELENIVITPHLGGATLEAITNHSKMALSELKAFENNEPLEYEY